MKDRIEEILKLIIIGISDQHPRIKYGGFKCLELFITDQTPKIQINYHSEIIPQIINVIRIDPEFKIKGIATKAMIKFLSILNQKYDDLETTDKLKAENISNLNNSNVYSKPLLSRSRRYICEYIKL